MIKNRDRCNPPLFFLKNLKIQSKKQMKNISFTITVSVKTPEGQTITIDEVNVLNGTLWDVIHLRTPNRESIRIENVREGYSMFNSRTESSAMRFRGS
jgi:hypothetical protein